MSTKVSTPSRTAPSGSGRRAGSNEAEAVEVRVDLRRSRGRLVRIIGPFTPLLILVLWEVASRVGVLDARFFPPPSAIAETFWTMLSTGDLVEHAAVTLSRIAIGFLMGGIPGLVLGIALGSVTWLRTLLGPIFASLLPVPKVAIFPLLLLVFGLGEMSKYVIVGIGVFFYIFYNAMGGVLQTPQIHFDVATANGANRLQRWSTVALPSALPSIFTGLKLAVGGAFVIIAASEFVGSRNGLGYLIWSSWTTFAVAKMYVGIVTISALGYLSTTLVTLLERRLIPWSRQ
ncbi:ABC transporter permease [Parenemella sanctibonifatiensis]|uniref:Taurine ABC transporter permease n=1 Tax=Parenemella sanctibonifatiensis TaxID=2016505 RepID=A0A255EVU2_9ACTN|nr:ABC transporter permease [Parenemella sanctibonifatiensis]OYN92253.1 taurine ABC transporter permease [Parenemella sanctibonifatiensis]